MNQKLKLDRMIKKAIKREDLDDHLTNEERQVIVDLHKVVYPTADLPVDLTTAYLEIIY